MGLLCKSGFPCTISHIQQFKNSSNIKTFAQTRFIDWNHRNQWETHIHFANLISVYLYSIECFISFLPTTCKLMHSNFDRLKMAGDQSWTASLCNVWILSSMIIRGRFYRNTYLFDANWLLIYSTGLIYAEKRNGDTNATCFYNY